MKLITAAELTHSFGDHDLYAGLALQLNARERVGLVGPNGVGKTTLLMTLAGLLEPTAGSVTRHADLSVGYLRQEAVLTFAGQDNTLYEEMLSVFADVRALERELAALAAQLAQGGVDDALLTAYGDVQAAYEHAGGYDYETEIKLVLLGLGFAEEEWSMPLTHLSGGQKTRLLLGRLLLEKPDLLILDEPTNHLDVSAVEWLERTLRFWDGTLLIVSHDRLFLDNVISHVWELSPSALRVYRGSYSDYVVQRQQEWEREQSLFAAEKARLEAELAYIQKNIAGSRSDSAKGRLKRLTRDLVLMEQVGVTAMQNQSWLEIGGRVRALTANEAARRLRFLQPPSGRPPRLKIRLESAEPSQRVILTSAPLTIGYPDAPLFTTPPLRLERGQRVALVGDNGSGKTTLLRTLLGSVAPVDGALAWGEHVQVGYFAQAHDQLDHSRRVIDELIARAPMALEKARNYLAGYLFRGHDVFKRIDTLSGGERGRLALAILAAEGANVLLLDEPTNHLDLPSQEVLQSVLEGYDGTLVVVSHDRYLIARLATQVWAIEGAQLRVVDGGYETFIGRTILHRRAEPSPLDMPAPDPETLDWIQADAPAPPAASDRGDWRRRAGALEDALDQAELLVAELTALLEAAEAAGDDAEVTRLTAALVEAEVELGTLSADWDALMGG